MFFCNVVSGWEDAEERASEKDDVGKAQESYVLL